MRAIFWISNDTSTLWFWINLDKFVSDSEWILTSLTSFPRQILLKSAYFPWFLFSFTTIVTQISSLNPPAARVHIFLTDVKILEDSEKWGWSHWSEGNSRTRITQWAFCTRELKHDTNLEEFYGTLSTSSNYRVHGLIFISLQLEGQKQRENLIARINFGSSILIPLKFQEKPCCLAFK